MNSRAPLDPELVTLEISFEKFESQQVEWLLGPRKVTPESRPLLRPPTLKERMGLVKTGYVGIRAVVPKLSLFLNSGSFQNRPDRFPQLVEWIEAGDIKVFPESAKGFVCEELRARFPASQPGAASRRVSRGRRKEKLELRDQAAMQGLTKATKNADGRKPSMKAWVAASGIPERTLRRTPAYSAWRTTSAPPPEATFGKGRWRKPNARDLRRDSTESDRAR